MRKRILVLGSGGMAGHVITLYLRGFQENYEVFDIARSDNQIKPSIFQDVTDFEMLKSNIQHIKPDCIINCVGLLNQVAENNPDKAILVNSYLPHFLAGYTKGTDCKIIHISTDCVFSGNKGDYVESDFRDGKGFYAQSKALGELVNSKDLTIRTSIIGPELSEKGIGLFHWFSQQKGQINGYTNAFWSGITTIELAKSIHYFLNSNLSGLCHLTNGVKISKFDLLGTIKKVFPLSGVIEIQPYSEYSLDKSLVNTRTDIAYTIPDYLSMIEELYNWIKTHEYLYTHYKKIIK